MHPTDTKAFRSLLEFMPIVWGICLMSMLATFSLSAAAKASAGIPLNHVVRRENGQYFYAPRGAGPLEERERTSISRERYLKWLKYERLADYPGKVCAVTLPIVVIHWWWIVRTAVKSRAVASPQQKR